MNTKYKLLLLAILFIANFSYSQTVVCEGSSCTANDYTLDTFYLGDASGTPFGPGYCEPGDTVNAHIWTNFSANSVANRYSLYMHFNLYVNGVYIATMDECYYNGLPIPTNVELDLLSFDWDCGAEIVLRDFYMSWQPTPGKLCGCSNAKCYSEAAIVVRGPLIANLAFSPSCASAYTLDFMSTTTGGAPPYTFLWNFGDGSTSTLENPSHTYTSNGPYTVTLTVQDTQDTDSYEYEIVSFDPNLPPEIYAPPNSNIEGCSTADIPLLPFSTSAVSITEAEFNSVGGNLVLSNNIVSLTYIDTVSGTCPTSVTRTFNVIDTCNNSASDTQIFVINDTTLPTASNPAPIYVQCVTDVPAPDINVVTNVNDNCAGTVVSFVSDVSNGNTCPEIITRTYSVTDSCGNTINVTQSIIINDDIAPTASNPGAITVECLADVPAPNINDVTDEADNCSAPTVSFISDVTSSGSCPISITRTYRITDTCNNSIVVTQIITVNDITPPTASNPADISVECSSLIPVADPSIITDEADNCAIPTVAFVSDVSNTGTCPEVITRTYSVTDDCGNQTLVTQNFTIEDTTLPTASNPAPINVECISDVPAPDVSVISDATDNCSIPIVSFISDVSTGQCPQIITRTYRIEDGCGNTVDIIQDINVVDTTSPTASNPADIMISCSDPIPVPNIALVTDAADNCSAPIVAFVNDVSNGACPEVITRTYSVTDECGNTINVSHNIISDDVDPPTLTTPLADATVNCDAIPPTPNLTFNDNCSSNVTSTYSETNTNVNNTIDYTITRTWVVTDSCGNSDTFTQTLTVLIANCFVPVCASDCGAPSDTTPPTATILGPLNVSCESDIPAPNTNVVIGATDNCSATVTVAFVSENVVSGCFEKIIRIYSVTDKCGNQILLERRISVVDNTPPTASNPAPITVPCTSAIPAPDVNVVTDEADDCSTPVKVAFVSDVANNACNQRIIRTYSVTDGCGNSINVTQEINVVDNVPPTASAPATINVECISNVPIPNTNVITDEADNCSTPTVTFISDISDNNVCPETITRTYRVTDECGNFIDIAQTILVFDTIPPTASNPSPIQVSCIGDVPMANVNVVTDEADNCSFVIVAFVNDVSDNLSCPETITRTYSVTDVCGNAIEVYQSIIIHDLIPPTASNPSSIQVPDNASVPIPDITVVTDEADNCSVPTVAFVNDISDNLSCPETITRTYSVTDACGNAINVTQAIIILDDVNPTATAPNPLAVQCISDVPSPDINVITGVSDNSSTPTVTFVSDVSDNQSCPETITRTYNVADDCGNSIQVLHIIIVDDDTPPTASNPASTYIDSNDPIPVSNVNVVIDEADNCGIPTVAFVSEISNLDSCTEIITRTYSVTDNCGNAINVKHDIIINDNTNPTASNLPNINLTCDANIPAPDTNLVTDAADNFSTPTVIFVDDVSDEQTCPETITRRYRIIDACGHYLDVTQNIIINDTILPTASDPASITLPDANNIPAPDPLVVIDEADNCSVPTVAFVNDSSDNLSCPETITRTYSVTDACGNTINVTQAIIILDDVNPTATAPNPLAVQCISDVPSPDINVITGVSDNSSTPTVTFVSDVSDNQSCPETITRTYNVADDCGNSIQVTHIIVVNDDTPPTASNPASTNIDSNDPIPASNVNVVIDEADNCGIPTVAFVSEISNLDSCTEIITRTYSVTDNCGNAINVKHDIIINDNTNPTASNLPNINLTCDDNVPAPDTNLVTDAADNFSTPTVIFVDDVSDEQTCPETITRRYRVIDACGHYLDVTQNIIINDTVLPTASDPATTTLPDANNIPPPDSSVVIDEADNCSVPTVTFESETNSVNGCNLIITRIYRVTDACDNFIDVEHIIAIIDDTDPTASNPADTIVNCYGDVPAIDTAVVTDAADNSGLVNVNYLSEISMTQNCDEIITRTYRVIDNCNNYIDVYHSIYIIDDIDPIMDMNLEDDVIIYCDVEPAAPVVTFSDNCTTNVAVNFNEQVLTFDSENYDIIRTWTGTDDCNNSTIFTQTIHMTSFNETTSTAMNICIDQPSFNLNDLVSVNSAGEWTGSDMSVLNGTLFDPTIVPEGDYSFTYTTIINHCISMNQFDINLNDDCIEYPCIKSIFDVEISKLVTPNGDLDNETFEVAYKLNEKIDDYSTCDIIVTVQMFNRWGTKVFESKNYNNDWAGNAPLGAFGDAIKLPTGTYYYVVNLLNSGLKPIQGFIYLGTEQ